ncbi:MAG: DUF4345 family protein [Nevskiales bacterium]
MSFGQIVLLVAALLFAGFGVAFLIQPAERIAVTGLNPTTATALTELRAYYGAFEIAFAVFLVLGAILPAWRVPALALLAISAGALALGRGLGLLLDGGPQLLTLKLIASEAVICALATAAWWREG